MEAPLPAITTVRGFHGTPVTSGDEDSDYSLRRGGGDSSKASSNSSGGPRRTRKKRMPVLDDVVSANCSPVLRPASSGSPAVSGIAKLRMQLEPLSLDTTGAAAGWNAPAKMPSAGHDQPGEPGLPCQPRQKSHHFSLLSKLAKKDRADKPDASDTSRTQTGDSSRSNSNGAMSSSNTSGDETGAEAETGGSGTSYVIRLENDFVSDSVRDAVPLATWMDIDTASEAAQASTATATDEAAVLAAETVLFSGEAAAGAAAEASVDDGGHEASAAATASSSAPPKGRKMTASDFTPLRCLGKGSYGTVLLVKQQATGRLYAQKQFKKASLVVHKKLVEQTKTERQILESVNRHPFVVKLYYAFQDHEKLYLILEYGQGGELFTHLSAERMFSEPTAAFYMAEMVLALSHLHDTLGVVYRDLKPENCLLDAEGHLLLTDFGLSKVALPGEGRGGGGGRSGDDSGDDSACCHSILGTVEYMAPEVVQGQKYGRAVDWWSFGALGYDLLTGNPPFRGRNNAKIQDNIVRQKLVLPYFLSPDAKDLLTRLLRKDPRKRLGAHMPRDLAVLQGHRFFRKIDWARLAARALDPPIQPVITDPELAENFAPEFTDLPMSPVLTSMPDRRPFDGLSGGFSPASPRGMGMGMGGHGHTRGRSSVDKEDPFGGFSFVASTSLLNESAFPR